MAFKKWTPKYHRRRVDDKLVEQVYSVLKDCQVDVKGHVVASVFRGNPDDPRNLVEQAETENVIMQWYIDLAQTLPLLLFNCLAGALMVNDNYPYDGVLGFMTNAYGVGLGDNGIPNLGALYQPANWYSREAIFYNRGSNSAYLPWANE